MRRDTPALIALSVAVVSMAVSIGTAEAANRVATDGASAYAKERADCEAGRTQQDRVTCLREAGAAEQERQHHGLANAGVAQRNATERCKPLPEQDRADCVARITGLTMPNQRVTTTGSVASGGILRTITTTTIGAVPPAQAASAASASPPR